MKNNQEEVKKFIILLEYNRFCIVITLTITSTAFNQKKITAACDKGGILSWKTTDLQQTDVLGSPPKRLLWCHCPK